MMPVPPSTVHDGAGRAAADGAWPDIVHGAAASPPAAAWRMSTRRWRVQRSGVSTQRVASL